jgi:DUF2075 family protein
MILYQNTSEGFLDDVETSMVTDKMEDAFKNKFGHTVSPAEKSSWQNSLAFMGMRIRAAQIPNDCGVLLEYNLPGTARRIDFLISGHDDLNQENFVIVELKQWDKAEEDPTPDMPHTVRTFVGGGIHEVLHPSYQAYSYKRYLEDMSSAMEKGTLHPYSCAYLHNYAQKNPEPLLSPQFSDVIADTPVFFKHDTRKLEQFIHKYVGKGKGLGILYEIADGKIRPTKDFVTYITELFKGNSVFTLLDEQQIAYDQIMRAATLTKGRVTVLVNGGPGTGKSVVAMNAFVHLLNQGFNVRYITPNSAFKEYLIDELASHKSDKKSRLEKIITGSTLYWDAHSKDFDILIVDEAHRLKDSTAYMYPGEGQVQDMIRASRVNIFFVDDEQQIRPEDEGSVSMIEETAKHYGSEIRYVHLTAQFRCSGEDGYINWLNDVLQIENTANFNGWDNKNYEVKIFDDPNELVAAINEKNREGRDARVVAGFAWPWTSKKDGNYNAEVNDVSMPEYNFALPWNRRNNQYVWSIDEERQNEIGCIHTIQGQEKDYIGVIIGYDMRYDPQTGKIYADYDEYYDTTGKKGLKNKPDELCKYIKNIYKILLTRGRYGCYIFVRDQPLRQYMKHRLAIALRNQEG